MFVRWLCAGLPWASRDRWRSKPSWFLVSEHDNAIPPDAERFMAGRMAGAPVESDEYPLTVGPDGPILLHDHYLIEQMASFNRERIPERQPHAKGGGALEVHGSDGQAPLRRV